LSRGILLSAGERLAESLAGKIVGVSRSALSYPFFALERWQGLGVVGNVGSRASQARAIIREGVRVASVVGGRAVCTSLRASVLLSTAPTQSNVGIDRVRLDIATGSEVGLSRDHADKGGEGHDKI